MNSDKILFRHQIKETITPSPFIKPVDSTHTYAAFNPSTGLTKIGRSTNYQERIRGIEAKKKCKLKLIIAISGDHEKRLHTFFKSKKAAEREWFYLRPADIKRLSGGHIL